MNNKTSNLLKFSAIALVITLPILSTAKSEKKPIYFADHVVIPAGKTMPIPYQFPSSEYVIECHDAGSGDDSKLGAMEWTYKGVNYKSEIGYKRSLTLVRENTPNTPAWNTYMQMQTADAAGTLSFTNLSASDLYLDCAYIVGPNPYL